MLQNLWLTVELAYTWDKYVLSLYLVGIYLIRNVDYLTWDESVFERHITVKEVYRYISQSHLKQGERW